MVDLDNRQQWIDWMKVIGMLLIIWGHCYPRGFEPFIYAFNVPVFFMVSGYLVKHEQSNKKFWSKNLKTLIIPYIILCEIKDLGNMLEHVNDCGFLWTQGCILLGIHSYGDFDGCGNMWFVYTLFLIKLINQYCCSKSRYTYIIVILSILGAIIYNKFFVSVSWAVTCIFVALPYFILGQYCRKFNINLIITRIKNTNKLILISGLLLSMSLLVIIADYNGFVKMYLGEYGNSVCLAYCGGIIGSIVVFILSVLLNRFRPIWSYYISIGTLVILDFHRDISHPLLKLIDKMDVSYITNGMMTFVVSTIVLISFVPIIWIIRKWCPMIIGYR